jgi:hypothetical protein
MQMIVKYRMLRERFFGRGIGKKNEGFILQECQNRIKITPNVCFVCVSSL